MDCEVSTTPGIDTNISGQPFIISEKDWLEAYPTVLIHLLITYGKKQSSENRVDCATPRDN